MSMFVDLSDLRASPEVIWSLNISPCVFVGAIAVGRIRLDACNYNSRIVLILIAIYMLNAHHEANT